MEKIHLPGVSKQPNRQEKHTYTVMKNRREKKKKKKKEKNGTEFLIRTNTIETKLKYIRIYVIRMFSFWLVRR